MLNRPRCLKHSSRGSNPPSSRIKVDEVCKMGLTDRLQRVTNGGRPPETASAGGLLIGAAGRRPKDAIAGSLRRFKVKVHQKVFGTSDCAKHDALGHAQDS